MAQLSCQGLCCDERNLVLFAGLKGAVPILLGSFLLAAHVPDAGRCTASSRSQWCSPWWCKQA